MLTSNIQVSLAMLIVDSFNCDYAAKSQIKNHTSYIVNQKPAIGNNPSKNFDLARVQLF